MSYPVPDVTPPPCLATGRLTFGCLGSAHKITDAMITVWSRILRATPGSRLLLKNRTLDDASNRGAQLARFADQGVVEQRLVLEGPEEHFAYSSSGYGELLDPYEASGINANNKPASLNMIDAPWFRARLRLPSGATITRAERILAFQSWLVVASGGKAKYVLASTEPFSLVFWLTANPQPGALSIDVPPHAFAFYGEAGIARTVRKGGSAPTVKILAGKGGRDPLMKGPVANDRDEQWMQAKGLKT